MKPKRFNPARRGLGITGVLLATGWPLCRLDAKESRDSSDEMTPYSRIDPPVEGEKTAVRLFFMYSCPYCRQHGPTLSRWGGTLPKTLSFFETPVVGMTRDSLVPAFGYYAMRMSDPARLYLYSEAYFQLIQDKGKPISDEKMCFLACRAAGSDINRYAKALASGTVRQSVIDAVRLSSQSKLMGTPCIVVGGRYSITPEVTNGINEQFYTLANAVVSRLIVEGAG